MFQRNFVSRICRGFLIAIAIYLSTFITQPSLAQGNFNLKSDIISLKSRISRLEQEVSRLRSSSSRSLARPDRIQQPSPSSSNRTIPKQSEVDGTIASSDSLYERFAVLLIELKEDVKNLDRRLTEIENSRGNSPIPPT